jgi:hypothetical protein
MSAMSDDMIEIRGQSVSLYRDGPDGPRLDREVHLGDFLQAVASTHPGPMKDRNLFLPGGTRLVQIKGASTILVIEQPPQVRQIRWSNERMGKGGAYEAYRLAFPYTVYVFTFYRGEFEDLRLYYRTAPLRAGNEPVYLSNLMNVQADLGLPSCARACLRGRPPGLTDLPLAEQSEGLLNYFWASGFNMDIEGNCFDKARRLDARIATIETWQEASEADPLFPLDVRWELAAPNLQAEVERQSALRHNYLRPISNASGVADLLYRLDEKR